MVVVDEQGWLTRNTHKNQIKVISEQIAFTSSVWICESFKLKLHFMEILWFVNKFCPALIRVQIKAHPNVVHSIIVLHT